MKGGREGSGEEEGEKEKGCWMRGGQDEKIGGGSLQEMAGPAGGGGRGGHV